MTTELRIASLLSSATEMLFGLGLGDQVVAVSHECDFPAPVANRPRVTFSRIDGTADSLTIDRQVRSLMERGEPLYGIQTDLLESLAPDLIVTQAQCDVCSVRYEDVLQAVNGSPVLAGRPVLPLNPTSLADVLVDIGRVAEAAGVPKVGEQFVGSLQQRAAAVRERTFTIDADLWPRVACIEWIDPPFLAANWMPQLITWAGGNDGRLTRPFEHSTTARWPDIVAFDPEVVIVMPCGFDLARTFSESSQLKSMPGWSGLSAVRNGRAYATDGSAYFNRSGPRLVESLEILAHLFHPNVHPVPAGLEPALTWRPI